MASQHLGLPTGPGMIHTALPAPLRAEGFGVGSLHSLRASLLQRQAGCQGQAQAHPVSGQSSIPARARWCPAVPASSSSES